MGTAEGPFDTVTDAAPYSSVFDAFVNDRSQSPLRDQDRASGDRTHQDEEYMQGFDIPRFCATKQELATDTRRIVGDDRLCANLSS